MGLLQKGFLPESRCCHAKMKKAPFTPLESPAIYGGDTEKKCSFIIEGRVKCPTLSNGVHFFTIPLYQPMNGIICRIPRDVQLQLVFLI